MTWVRDNAATYGVDPSRVALGGVSAGAITAELVGYNNSPPHVLPTVVLDFLGSMYGTQNVIQPGAPPAFMFHGTADTQVPFSGDQAVADQLTAEGVYHEFYVAQGLGHELDPSVVFTCTATRLCCSTTSTSWQITWCPSRQALCWRQAAWAGVLIAAARAKKRSRR